MSAKFCSRCGNKIPRQHRSLDGSVKRTWKKRTLCYICSPLVSDKINDKIKPLDNKTERHKRKEALVKMLGGKCSRCGYKKSSSALSFHHVDPKTKNFDISHNGKLLGDWDILVAEANKCILLCLNCHSEIEEEIRKKNK